MKITKDGEMELIDGTIDLKMTSVMERIFDILESCRTPEQLEVVTKMIDNYHKLYDSETDRDFMLTAVDIHNSKLKRMYAHGPL